MKNLIENIIFEIEWRWGKYVLDPLREIKWAYQRVVRGWDDSEVWSLDWSISEKMVPMLKELKENHCGTPAQLTEEEWDTILQQMIDGFQAKLDKDDIAPSGTYLEEWNRLDEIQKKGLQLFIKHFDSLWD